MRKELRRWIDERRWRKRGFCLPQVNSYPKNEKRLFHRWTMWWWRQSASRGVCCANQDAFKRWSDIPGPHFFTLMRKSQNSSLARSGLDMLANRAHQYELREERLRFLELKKNLKQTNAIDEETRWSQPNEDERAEASSFKRRTQNKRAVNLMLEMLTSTLSWWMIKR